MLSFSKPLPFIVWSPMSDLHIRFYPYLLFLQG